MRDSQDIFVEEVMLNPSPILDGVRERISPQKEPRNSRLTKAAERSTVPIDKFGDTGHFCSKIGRDNDRLDAGLSWKLWSLADKFVGLDRVSCRKRRSGGMAINELRKFIGSYSGMILCIEATRHTCMEFFNTSCRS